MKKVTLNKETLRLLETSDLKAIQGGRTGLTNCLISRCLACLPTV